MMQKPTMFPSSLLVYLCLPRFKGPSARTSITAKPVHCNMRCTSSRRVICDGASIISFECHLSEPHTEETSFIKLVSCYKLIQTIYYWSKHTRNVRFSRWWRWWSSSILWRHVDSCVDTNVSPEVKVAAFTMELKQGETVWLSIML
jgi:hypothetical protein